jgi:NitT/TauT family transport system substrate-binding protein/putative hydroxymethylpyrimidine transport system substrate-binding protein
MNRVAAPLAAALAAIAFGACGDGGAEPGASNEATLVLDFQPNAVHAGIYAAQASGAYAESGVALEIREPSASTDAPKLLAGGRAEFAILDIHDLAIARDRGLDLVGVGAIVQRPLAAVIAGDRAAVASPRELEGSTVGVTGLPSDDAVLDSVLESGGADPGAVERVTIGFDSVAALAAGRVAAVTAFWNAEGVALRRLGLRTREFRVDDFGAPPYPELILTTTAETLAERPDAVDAIVAATASGYDDLLADPQARLGDLLEAVPELDAGEQRAQLAALISAGALGPGVELDRRTLERWAAWEAERGLVAQPPEIERAFALDG